ncbi:MAG: hypothetical protein M3N10_02060 [Actinomycetota bacterium]|nr:hypothetical protein [Actinomycetota bacterium]HZY65948.1 hypothetical protein [Rubrobacteraceae bacterium]
MATGPGACRRRDLSASMGKANVYVLVTSGPATVLLAVGSTVRVCPRRGQPTNAGCCVHESGPEKI